MPVLIPVHDYVGILGIHSENLKTFSQQFVYIKVSKINDFKCEINFLNFTICQNLPPKPVP